MYPACGQASAVLDVLQLQLDKNAVDVRVNETVTQLTRKDSRFVTTTKSGDSIFSDNVLVAGGGMAAPKLGSNGSVYPLLTCLGHRLIDPFPALTQLITEHSAIQGLSGLRMPALLTLCIGETSIAASQGEVLFTDYGVSGVCTMQLSGEAANAIKHGKKPILYLDLSPLLCVIPQKYTHTKPGDYRANIRAVLELLEKRTAEIGLPPEHILTGIVPRLFAQKIGSPGLYEMARKLAAYPVAVTGVRGFENAQVTRGGIDPTDFDPSTMESHLVHGLYAAGEVLDVDGDCGGFNLMFAFASGILAGSSIKRQRSI